MWLWAPLRLVSHAIRRSWWIKNLLNPKEKGLKTFERRDVATARRELNKREWRDLEKNKSKSSLLTSLIISWSLASAPAYYLWPTLVAKTIVISKSVKKTLQSNPIRSAVLINSAVYSLAEATCRDVNHIHEEKPAAERKTILNNCIDIVEEPEYKSYSHTQKPKKRMTEDIKKRNPRSKTRCRNYTVVTGDSLHKLSNWLHPTILPPEAIAFDSGIQINSILISWKTELLICDGTWDKWVL